MEKPEDAENLPETPVSATKMDDKPEQLADHRYTPEQMKREVSITLGEVPYNPDLVVIDGEEQRDSKPIEKLPLQSMNKENELKPQVAAFDGQTTEGEEGEVADPDEDDLDDLDDMLDEFTPAKPEPKAASGTGKPITQTPSTPPFALLESMGEDEFEKQLQAGMADLLGEFQKTPEIAAQFEHVLKELSSCAAPDGEARGAATPPAPSPPKISKSKTGYSTTAVGSTGTEESFQDTIKKTMERMATSGDQATAAAATAVDNPDDLLAEIMKAMQSSGLDGEAGEEDFSKMLLGMMEQLTNKEILYEPMKELDDKFPGWMEKNQGKVKETDMERYKEQQVYVKEIVKRFELKNYKDENAADREYIVDRMQKMQAAGSPPADLVGDMAAAQEAFGVPEGCPTQ